MDIRKLHRGKRKDNGEWVEGFYAEFQLGINSVPFIGASNSVGTMMWFEVYPFTVGQSTGTTDVNAKIIFEGDVVLSKRIIDGSDWRGVIVFWNGCFAIKGYNGNVPAIDLCKNIEIIGNIHDDYEWPGGAQ